MLIDTLELYVVFLNKAADLTFLQKLFYSSILFVLLLFGLLILGEDIVYLFGELLLFRILLLLLFLVGNGPFTQLHTPLLKLLFELFLLLPKELLSLFFFSLLLCLFVLLLLLFLQLLILIEFEFVELQLLFFILDFFLSLELFLSFLF